MLADFSDMFSDMNSGLNNADSNVFVSYNPNDFFYNGIRGTPTDSDCKNLEPSLYDNSWDVFCNEHNLTDNIDKCTKRALCVNKDQAKQLFNIQKKNRGVDKKYDDDNLSYDNALFTTANLGIGIVILFGLITTTLYPSTSNP
jgi:hypothetical protein